VSARRPGSAASLNASLLFIIFFFFLFFPLTPELIAHTENPTQSKNKKLTKKKKTIKALLVKMKKKKKLISEKGSMRLGTFFLLSLSACV
jgi:hypothetical protein